MITLHDYQNKDIASCGMELTTHQAIIYQLPTGGGKTIIFTEITKRYIDKNPDKNVCIVVHRSELLRQTRANLFKHYNIIACEVIAGMKEIPPARVYICMVESLHRRITKLKHIGLLILDEAHIAVHNKIIDKLNPPLILGVTATPISSNKKEPLKKRYQSIVCGPQISTLIEEGFLCQNLTYAPKESVDRNLLEMKYGDFDEHKMGQEFSKPKFIINTVEAYKKYAEGTKCVVFNVNIEHNRLVCEEFIKNGYDARYMDSNSTTDEHRIELLQWLKNTPGAILCNVGILTTGFDEPTIETIIVNKATSSIALWIQMTGRGSRTTPLKHMFRIIDMGGNAITHGDWCDNRDWKEIFHDPVKKSKNGVGPCKTCPQCEAILPTPVLECKYCKFIFPPRQVATEELLSEYVLLTKNIDVQGLMEKHENKKQYYTFFSIIRQHVWQFNKTKKQVTPEIFEYLLISIGDDCKKWCLLNNKKYNTFNKTLLSTELQKELKYEHRIL